MGEMTPEMVEYQSYVPVATRAIEAIVPLFHPFSSRATGSIWHEQVKGLLCALGLNLLAVPLPEYRVRLSSRRSGMGRIDVAWFTEFLTPFNFQMMAAFEIDSTAKSRSISKLKGLDDVPLRYVVSSGPGSHEEKVATFSLYDTQKTIKQIIITPTDNFLAFQESAWKVRELLNEHQISWE